MARFGDAAAFCVAGVALGDIHFRFAWQALVLRGRASLMALGGALGPGLGGRDAAAFCVVALGDIAWQAISHPRSFCVAGASLMALGGALGT